MTFNDPVTEYGRILDCVLRDDDPLVILIGLDRGFPLDALEARSRTTKVLAFEPFAAAADAMFARRDYRKWISTERLTLFVGPDYTGAAEAWRTITIGDGSRMPPLVIASGLQERFGSDIARAKRLAAHIVTNAQRHLQSRRHLAGRYLLNTIANIPAIVAEANASSLACAWTNVPAVIVGSGPSLARNIEDLRGVQGRVLTIAVDAAVPQLLAGGVRPHVVVSADPSDQIVRYICDHPDTRDMWLVAEASVDASLLRVFAGRTFIFKGSSQEPWPWLTECGAAREPLQAWGSALTTGFDLARVASCDPLIFLGADLTGAAETELRHYDQPGVLQHRQTVRSYQDASGPPAVRTSAVGTVVPGAATGLAGPRFVELRDWIVARSLNASHHIVNATGAGSLIGGRIVQSSLASLTLPSNDGGHAGIRARLREQWNLDRESRAALRSRMLLALESSALPRQTWLDFAGTTATSEQLEGCVADAGDALRLRSRKAAYLASRREFYDRHARSLEGARQTSHRQFSEALLQAPALQAHVLLDFLQRTYPGTQYSDIRDILRSASHLRGEIRALDFGCGLGRTMKPLVAAGLRVDGVDISGCMLEFVRQHPVLAGCDFFLTEGLDCGGAPDGAYDLVYSHLCLSDITSRSIRNDVLDSMARALRPGGVVVVEIAFHRDQQARSVPAPHVSWSADDLDLCHAEEEMSVWATPDDIGLIHADFSRNFRDVRLQFLDAPGEATLPTQLIVSGATAAGLAARVYASARDADDL